MKNELKLCPFCGGSPTKVCRMVTCNNPDCEAYELSFENTLWLTHKAWNHRPIEGALRAENEKLRAKCETLEVLVAALEALGVARINCAIERSDRSYELLAKASTYVFSVREKLKALK